MTIDLGHGLSLIEAEDYREFARFAAFYRRDPLPGAKLGYRLERFCEHTACWWIGRDDRRVGGVVLAPNAMTNLFLIPPFEDHALVALLLTAHLRDISDPKLSIRASDLYMDETPIYFRIGYQLMPGTLLEEPADDFSHRFYCMMLRPTQPVETPPLGDTLVASTPTRRDAKRIARFLCDCYHGSDALRTTPADFEATVLDCFGNADRICRAASMLIKQDGDIVGASLVTIYEGWPMLFDIGVRRDMGRRGLAQHMIGHALGALSQDYPALRLFVELGNPAQMLYHRMGFIASEPMVTLALSGWGEGKW